MASVLIQMGSLTLLPQQLRESTRLGKTIDKFVRALEELVHQVPEAGAMRLDQLITQEPIQTELSEREVALLNAKLLIAMHRLRERAFGTDLFSDPAWNVLIELYVALAEGVQVSVGNAGIASGLPLTSALRLCHQLQQRKIVVRERDPFDRRRVLLRLSDETYDALTHVLSGTKIGHFG